MAEQDKFFHLVTFEMNKEMFAIPIMNIQEIIRWTEIVPIPQSPAFVEGVINLRSKVIPVVSLQKRFASAVAMEAVDDKTRIVIADFGELVVGFIVDSVHEVLRIDQKNFEPTPEIAVIADRRCVKGIVKRDTKMIMVLDLEGLFSKDEAAVLKDAR